MDIIEKERIELGDLVLFRGEVFQLVGGGCKACEMQDKRTGRCPGYCWRWPDMENKGFRFIGYEYLFEDTDKVYVTVDLFTPRIHELAILNGYHYKPKKGGER